MASNYKGFIMQIEDRASGLKAKFLEKLERFHDPDVFHVRDRIGEIAMPKSVEDAINVIMEWKKEMGL